MMKQLVGDKKTLGVECVVNAPTSVEGRLFMYVKGQRYGQDDFDESIVDALERWLNFVDSTAGDYNDLFSMSANEFFQFVELLRNGEQRNNYRYDLTDIDENIMVRAGYAFDRHFIALIPSRQKEKLIIFKPNALDGNEIILGRGTFCSLLRQLYAKIRAE